MKKLSKRLFACLIVFILLGYMIPTATFATYSASADPRNNANLWKTALQKGYTTYSVPYSADNSTIEYWKDQWTGNNHLQGVAVDDDMRYLYTAYGTGFGKIDLETGEVVGYIKCVGDGLHAGCMAYYDGYVYCALEVRASLKCYVIQIDAGKMSGAMTTTEDWADAVRVILLDDVTSDIRDTVGDAVSNGQYAGYGEKKGHRYANAGFDGLTFGTYPGEANDSDADIYMMLTYGTYYWEANPSRFDDEHVVVRAYNTKDFLYSGSKYLLQLSNDNIGADGDGWAHTGTMNYCREDALKAAKTLFVPTGNVQWGAQNMEYDRSTGDLWLRTYGGSSGGPMNGKNFMIVDGSATPEHKEVQLGQNIDLSKTTYGYVSQMSDSERSVAEMSARNRAKFYSNSEENATLSAWNSAPNTGVNYEWSADQQWSPDGYPMGDIPMLKCVHGGIHEPSDSVMAYIGYRNILIDGTNLSGGDVGLISLGNDYFYSCNGTTMQLYHFNDGQRDSWTAVTKDNLDSFIDAEGLNSQPVSVLRTELSGIIARAEKYYPLQENYSDSTWAAYVLKLTEAKSAHANISSTAEELYRAGDALIQAEKNLRKGLDELVDEVNYASRLTNHMYTSATWAPFESAYSAARNAVINKAQQIKLDDVKVRLETAQSNLELDADNLYSTDTDISTVSFVEPTTGTYIYDFSTSSYHIFTGAAAVQTKVYADGNLAWQGAGVFDIPIANVQELKIVTDGQRPSGILREYFNSARVINGIAINGAFVDGFDHSVYDYRYSLEPGAPVPTIEVFATHGYTATILQASQVPGIAYIKVEDTQGNETVYSINFVYNKYVSNKDPMMLGITYLSDISRVDNDGNVNWEHDLKYLGLDCNYNGNPVGNNSVNSTAGGGIDLATAAGQTHYEKGISIEATDHMPIRVNGSHGANGSEGDSVYKEAFTSTDNLANYSRIKYYIAGKGYNSFKGVFGLSNGRWNHDKTDGTIRIYVDDVCKFTHNLKNEIGSFEVELDITGAETFSIQVDPENVNQRPAAVADNWCWGDIVHIGEARFIVGVEDATCSYIDELTTAGALATEHDLKVYQLGTMPGVWVGNGEQKTYAHAIKVEPTDHSTTGTNPIDRQGDDVYKQKFVDEDNLINYSRVKYDIQGMGFSRFRATFGNHTWNHQYTNFMLRIYVDDTCVLEQIGNGTLLPFDIDINVQGAKTITIQVDPENIYGTKNGVSTNWCWGDIMYLGWARFLSSDMALVPSVVVD